MYPSSNSAIKYPVTVGASVTSPAVIAIRDISFVVEEIKKGSWESQDLRLAASEKGGKGQMGKRGKGAAHFSGNREKKSHTDHADCADKKSVVGKKDLSGNGFQHERQLPSCPFALLPFCPTTERSHHGR